MRVVADEVDFARIHDQQRRRVVAVEEACVGIDQALQILALHALLVANAAPRDALLQHVDRGLQVNHQVRDRRVDREALVYLLIQRVFLVIEGHAREQPVLVEQEIRDPHRCEQIGLTQLLQLAHALEQEIQLGRQRAGARVLVKALEKRVFLGALEHHVCAPQRRQAPREAGLADANRTFDHDVAVCERSSRLGGRGTHWRQVTAARGCRQRWRS